MDTETSIEVIELILQLFRGFPVAAIAHDVLCDGMQTIPHAPEFRGVVIRFHTLPVFPLGIPHGLLVDTSGLLVSHLLFRAVDNIVFS